MTISKSLVIEKKYKDNEFIELMRDVIAESIESNAYYKELVKRRDFHLEDLNSIDELETIPYILTPFYKQSANFYNELLKIPASSPEFKYWNVSSCTTGDPSLVGINNSDVDFLFEMAKKCFLDFIPRDWDRAFISLFSPSIYILNRIVMRYTKVRPARSYSSNFYEVNKTMAKMKFLIKFSFLRALKAIILTRSLVGAFVINSKFVFKTFNKNLEKPEDERMYLALGGSAELVKNFIAIMKKKNITYNLGKEFDVVVGGGGWDGHKAQMKYDPIDKSEFVSEIIDAFGTEESKIIDIYGFTETPIIFGSHWSSKHNDFIMHCPPYARIIVRDRDKLEPVNVGETGFLEVVTPFGANTSINHAILVDDLVELISKNKCSECGYEGATFRIKGRIKDKEGIGCSSVVEWL
ncbi:MAG: hypothetical protein HWN66_09675 [Candidatus Helarchaeota archaeon]|nr:hypothetical protein [Candidatus Helarchaeota archaeon]